MNIYKFLRSIIASKLAVVILTITVICLASCGRPASYEKFLLQDERSQDGYYNFEIDFSDSLQLYDLYFYTRIDYSDASSRFKKESLPPLEVIWTSPDSVYYKEIILLEPSELIEKNELQSIKYSNSIKTLYRKDISPVIYGQWKLSAKFLNSELKGEIRGLGVIVSEKTK